MTNKYTQYISTYGGRTLLKEHQLNTHGVWQVTGEDPNCDFGSYSYHYQPNLGTFEGTLEDVINYAVDLPSFFTWGYGGTITLMQTKKITSDSNDLRARLLTKRLSIKAALQEVEDQLHALANKIINY